MSSAKCEKTGRNPTEFSLKTLPLQHLNLSPMLSMLFVFAALTIKSMDLLAETQQKIL